MKELKKVFSIFLIVFLIFGRFSPVVVFADELGEAGQQETQEVEETDSPDEPGTPPETVSYPEQCSSDTEIDNEAEVTNEVDSTAISGENSIEQPTPTPSPTVSLEEAEQATEAAETESTEEPETTPDESLNLAPEASPAVIETGDAVSVVEVENEVNSTEVNSQVLYQTLNIFVSQDGNIDLTTTPLTIADNVFVQNNNQEPVVNVAVIDNQNFAFLSNEIVSLANTGGNSIEGAEEATIDTGDAYSVVSLLNKVNTTFIDSTIHVVTINIFGNINGDILLPEFSSEDTCCGEVVEIESSAVVENDVDSSAVSGQNSIISSEDASITTGDANSVVNLINIVNTNLIDVTFYHLFINTFGQWLGDFLGWNNLEASAGGGNLSLSSTSSGDSGDSSCSTCSDMVLIENNACVVNNVSSTANTGGNSINGGEATINTGDAYSAVSIINFINTSIIHSLGFLGFINIFGLLDGDVGGASLFTTSEPESEPESELSPEVENTSEQESGPSTREEGGLLEVSQYNNVGTHVLPGDTITFFVMVKNPGTGRVYDTNLKISLLNNGLDMGGATFDLGTIDPGKGVKVTTGLVLSQDAEAGEYIARAVATGYVGPDNDLISASADSTFLIAAFNPFPAIPGITQEAEAAGGGEALGAITAPAGLTPEQKLWVLLLGSLTTYLTTQGYRERRRLVAAFSSRRRLLSLKSAALRSLLMSLTSFFS